MSPMPRPRLPYLQRETSRHGRVMWFVRRGAGPRARIHGEYGSPEFMRAYHAAAMGEVIPAAKKASKSSFEWLLSEYRKSEPWAALSMATRRQRDNIFVRVLKKAGSEHFTAFTKDVIVAGRDAHKGTPAQARNFLDAMRGLFAWAADAGHVKANPTTGVKNPKRKKGAGFPAWSEADVARYEGRWPPGTHQFVWLQVLLYTGMRRGDAVRIGWGDVSHDVITVYTEKSGETVEVNIPILPVLREALDHGPCGKETFICGVNGNRFTKESFGNAFSEAARAAGVNKSAHGVRKIGATRAAENGATVAELEAIFGWTGGGMASLYTRSADRKRLSMGAAKKLALAPAKDEVLATKRQNEKVTK